MNFRRHRAVTAALLAVVVDLALSGPTVAFAKVVGPNENTPLNLPSNQAHKLTVGGGGGGSLARTFVGLAIVVAVIYGLYWILRQVKASREERSVGRGLSSEASVVLSPGRSLHLVRAGSELVLVGVAEHGVTPIRTYTEAEAEQIGLIGHDDDSDDLPPRSPFGSAANPVLDALRRWTVRR